MRLDRARECSALCHVRVIMCRAEAMMCDRPPIREGCSTDGRIAGHVVGGAWCAVPYKSPAGCGVCCLAFAECRAGGAKPGPADCGASALETVCCVEIVCCVETQTGTVLREPRPTGLDLYL